MVGGKVLEVRREGDKVRIWCVGTGTEAHDPEVAIYVKPTERLPSAGDALWWHGRSAYWTPLANHGHPSGFGQGDKWDIQLERIGYTFPPGDSDAAA